MGKINILSKATAEKIAAGEVVERPANAIKEMVENSIDAGARSITVEIRHGGISYIRVADDGSGILPDDAEKAFMRHATSKIRDEEDLEHITTLGFRGEALCSIASVSKTDMLTKPADSPFGSHIVVEGGELTLNEEIGCPNGTTVTVENLFYNTPARMKFLKKDSAEAALVTEVCQRQALARPDVSIRLVRDGKEVFFTPGNNSLSDAVRCLWGKDFSSEMREVGYSFDGIGVTGLAGKNSLSRPSRSMQVFFVNGRSVVNKVLSLALSEAYKNELMVGRFPVAVLNIEMNPSLCDVNVHPTKTEIKFADDKAVYNAVYWAVKNMLGAAAGARNANPSFVRGGESYRMPFAKPDTEQISVRTRFRPYTPAPDESGGSDVGEMHVELNPILSKKQIERLDKETELKLKRGEIKSPIVQKAELFPRASKISAEKAEVEEPQVPEPIKIIGQLFSTYILAESEGALVLIDQHAAHERIRYEELRKSEERIAMQLLMIPQSAVLSPREYEAVTGNMDFLREMGFELEDLGGNTLLVRGIPADCGADDGEALLSELAGVLMGEGNGSIGDRRDRAMYTVACRSAIKGSKELTLDEMEKLVSRALALEGVSTCPHGRPISVKITKYQIEKMFKRIV